MLTLSLPAGEKLTEGTAADVQELFTSLPNYCLIQLLETGFLHADPHPGNLLRTPEGRICILDYGLMTEVSCHACIQSFDMWVDCFSPLSESWAWLLLVLSSKIKIISHGVINTFPLSDMKCLTRKRLANGTTKLLSHAMWCRRHQSKAWLWWSTLSTSLRLEWHCIGSQEARLCPSR